MQILHLTLEGTMQSYGYSARFPGRRTAGMKAPTLSAVIGMMASTCGIKREQSEELSEQGFTDLRIVTRTDTLGATEEDYQIMVYTSPKLAKKNKIIQKEFYTDAKFTVGVYAQNAVGENALDLYLKNAHAPKNAPFLGRKSYIPEGILNKGKQEWDSTTQFLAHAPLLQPHHGQTPSRLSTTRTTEPGERPTLIINDIPVSFDSKKRIYLPRPVTIEFITVAQTDAEHSHNETSPMPTAPEAPPQDFDSFSIVES